MGTSASAKGPRPGSPLIPPWADPAPDEVVPAPAPEDDVPEDAAAPGSSADNDPAAARPATLNLLGFRRSLGNAVASGASGGFGRALGSYARATGGGRTAARRLGSPLRTGGRIHSLFGTRTATGPNGQTITLASLDGLSVRVAVDRIVSALVPLDGDRDKVAAALQDALSTALAGAETFDQNAITPDVLTDMMVIYLRDVIFQTVIADSGRAFQRTDDLQQVARMERELLALVGQVVNDQARSLLTGSSGLGEAQMVVLQEQIVTEVWDVWESGL